MTSPARASEATGRTVSGDRIGSVVAALFGFLVVVSIGGSAGGYRATTWAWVTVLTLALAVATLLARRRIILGRRDSLYAGGLAVFGVWVGLSSLWTTSVPSTARETQRVVAYVALLVAGLLVVRSRTMRHALGGVLAAVTALAAYGLATRLVPDHVGRFDSVSFEYRLAPPVTYWNGLGILAVLGLLLALGFATRGRALATRASAAGALPLLTAAMYFTFSRGAWFAFGVGLAAAVILDPRRLQFLAGALCLAPWPALAIAAGEARDGLTTTGASLADATSDGHSLAALLVALSAGSALTGLLLAFVERRVTIPRSLRQAFAAVLVLVAIAAATTVWVTEGSPRRLTERAWDAFDAPPSSRGAPDDASARLLTLSSNGRVSLWRVSWESFRSEPVLGEGAGTFWQAWAREREIPLGSLEAHSLYAEVLGELGLVGLALLLVALLTPIAAALRVRNRGLVPAAAGAYLAWAAHAGVDWDWELLGVTGAALVCGVAVIAAARPTGHSRVLAPRARVVAACVLSLACVAAIPSLLAETALDAAHRTVFESPNEAIDDARAASRWAPWASEPHRLRGDAYAAQGNGPLALEHYRKALAKDPSSWVLWQAMSLEATGAERVVAREALRRLNPIIATDPPAANPGHPSDAYLATIGTFATNDWLCHLTGGDRGSPAGWRAIQITSVAVYGSHAAHPADRGPFPGKPSRQLCATVPP
jgi:tetratricopeptide (TPR) repeat protein